MTRRRIFFFSSLFAIFAIPAAALASGFGSHGGWHCDRGGEEVTAEYVTEKLGRFTDRVLDKVDASDAQYDEADAIVADAAPDLAELKNRAHELKAEAKDVLHADELDSAEVERVRGDAVQLFDEGTQRMVELMTDLRGVLTDEQRTELQEKWADRHG